MTRIARIWMTFHQNRRYIVDWVCFNVAFLSSLCCWKCVYCLCSLSVMVPTKNELCSKYKDSLTDCTQMKCQISGQLIRRCRSCRINITEINMLRISNSLHKKVFDAGKSELNSDLVSDFWVISDSISHTQWHCAVYWV